MNRASTEFAITTTKRSMAFLSAQAMQDRSADLDPIEVYVLCGERSAAMARRFLDDCAPRRTVVANDFPFPEYVDEPAVVFSDVMDLIHKLESETGEGYSIYWNAQGGVADQVMLFFTEDGSMIVGLGGPHISPETAFAEIQKIVNGKYGFISSGCAPPASSDEFIAICKGSTLVNLFEGVIRRSKELT